MSRYLLPDDVTTVPEGTGHSSILGKGFSRMGRGQTGWKSRQTGGKKKV